MSGNQSMKRGIDTFAVVGAPEVGKTSIICRFVDDSFATDYFTTECKRAYHREVSVCDGNQTLRVEVWDTPTHPRYGDAQPMSIAGLNGVVVVFDLSDAASFEAARSWLAYPHRFAPMYQVLLGNKADLLEDGDVVVSASAIQETAAEFKVPYLEVSAATGKNVEEAFELLMSNIRNKVALKPGRH